MRIELLQLETAECISVAEAKLHCHVDSNAEDGWFGERITAVRELAEFYIDKPIIPKSFRAYYDLNDVLWFKPILNLPRNPAMSITEIKYYDSSDDDTVFSSDNYRLSGNRIVLADGSDWPSGDLRLHDSLTIDFVAGFGLITIEEDETVISSNVPKNIKAEMLSMLAFFYENRGDASAIYKFSSLLQPYRKFSII